MKFQHSKMLFLPSMKDEEINFIEFGISIPKCVFHKESFDKRV